MTRLLRRLGHFLGETHEESIEILDAGTLEGIVKEKGTCKQPQPGTADWTGTGNTKSVYGILVTVDEKVHEFSIDQSAYEQLQQGETIIVRYQEQRIIQKDYIKPNFEVKQVISDKTAMQYWLE